LVMAAAAVAAATAEATDQRQTATTEATAGKHSGAHKRDRADDDGCNDSNDLGSSMTVERSGQLVSRGQTIRLPRSPNAFTAIEC
jgi:hypothetical protein